MQIRLDSEGPVTCDEPMVKKLQYCAILHPLIS